MAAMMAHDQNADVTVGNAEQKMIRKMIKIRAPNVSFADGKCFWPVNHRQTTATIISRNSA